VEVPPQLSQRYMAIMALWMRWDPFTDRMSGFDVSGSPELDGRDLWQYSADEQRERDRISRVLGERKERAEKQWWMAKMEEKLKAFATVDRSLYPDDLKAYVEELDRDAVDQREPNGVGARDEQPRERAEIERAETVRAEFEETASQEMEARRLERAEEISNALKYPEKPNELNPRR